MQFLQTRWVIILFLIVNAFWFILFYGERVEISKTAKKNAVLLEALAEGKITKTENDGTNTAVVEKPKPKPRCAKNGKTHGEGCGPNSIQCFIGMCICKRGWGGKYCTEKNTFSETNPYTKEECSKLTFESENKKPGYGKFNVYDFCEFYDHRYGIPVVSKQRWAAAQSFEDSVWSGAGHASDRNDEHLWGFENYDSLKPFASNLGDYAEFGCGPFTQTMTLAAKQKANFQRVVLVDPLLRSYLQKTVHCTYKSGTFLKKYTGDTLTLISAGAEDINFFHDTFDTVMMQNVLEHVTNGLTVLQNLYNAIKPGGILIFHERYYDTKIKDYFKTKKLFHDLGHPVVLNTFIMNHFLADFTPLQKKIFTFEKGTPYPTDEGIYIIARKKKE